MCMVGEAQTSRIPKHNEIRISRSSGYPVGGRRLHIGNHVGKSIFIERIKDEQYPNTINLMKACACSSMRCLHQRLLGWVALCTNGLASASVRTNDIQAVFVLIDQAGACEFGLVDAGIPLVPCEDWKTNERVEGKFQIVIPESTNPGPTTLSDAHRQCDWSVDSPC